MYFVLLVLCAVKPLLSGGFPYKRSIAGNFVDWLMLFASLVERCCLIKGFHIVGPVCGVSICPQWILLTKEAKLWCLLSCLSKRAVEQTVKMQVGRKIIKLGLCYCYVIWNSIIDDIYAPVCGETRGHPWIPVARITGVGLWWSSVRWFHRRWIPLIKDWLDFFRVCFKELFNKQYSCQWVEIPGRVCDVIVMCHLSIRHSAWLNIKIITSQL